MEKIQTVKLPNGQEAPVLTADLNKDIKMAIVSLNVLKSLVNLLPKVNLKDILDEMAGKLQALHYSKTATLKDYVEILHEELEFHESINLIKEFVNKTKPTVVEEAMVPGPWDGSC
jgi:predicted nuclease with TOPRIM domain